MPRRVSIFKRAGGRDVRCFVKVRSGDLPMLLNHTIEGDREEEDIHKERSIFI
jgi:hypothetical protein